MTIKSKLTSLEVGMKKLFSLILFIGLTLFLLFTVNNLNINKVSASPLPPSSCYCSDCGFNCPLGVYNPADCPICDPCQILGNCPGHGGGGSWDTPTPTPNPGGYTCQDSCIPSRLCISDNDLKVVSGTCPTDDVCCTGITSATPPPCDNTDFYCGDHHCNIYWSECNQTLVCGSGASYSGACDGLYYYSGHYVACPLAPANNLAATQGCDDPSNPVEHFTWLNGYDCYKTPTPTVYYCDKSFVDAYNTAHGTSFACTSGSVPTGECKSCGGVDQDAYNNHVGWYGASSDHSSPVNVPIVSDPWTSTSSNLTIGDTYRWLVWDSLITYPNGVKTTMTNQQQGNDFTVEGCVCNAPDAPSPISPSGSVSAGSQTITWTDTGDTYNLTIVDQTNSAYNVSVNNYASNSYTYTFRAGHTYTITVYANAACGAQSDPVSSSVSVPYTIIVNAFIDNNHDFNWDAPAEPSYNGTIHYTGTLPPVSPDPTTGADGVLTIANVPPGAETVTLTNVLPSGWSVVPSKTQTTAGNADATINFALEPPAPTCIDANGNILLTAKPSTIYQTGTSTITATCQGVGGQPIQYFWTMPPGELGTVDNSGTNTTTYHAPANAQPNGVVADPTVSVCNPGVTPPNALCNSYSVGVTVLPYFTISGNVFVDGDKDKLIDHGEKNYTGAITVFTSAGSISYPSTPPNGQFLISNLPAGEYFVTLQKVSGYGFTTPQTQAVKVSPNDGKDPYGLVTLTKCDPESSSGSCDANGDIANLNFGISNSFPWIQTGSAGGLPGGVGLSGDSSFAGGVNNPVPQSATSCTAYTSLNGPQGTPGVIDSSDVNPSFCQGGDPGCQNLSSSTRWVAGGATYPDPFIPSNLGVIRTSYNYVSSLAQAAGIDLTANSSDLAQYCSGGIANCKLSQAISHGVYIAKGELDLIGSGYTFPAGQNFVILVNGDLKIKEQIHVLNGSTVLFTSLKNIYVDSSVGEDLMTSTNSDVEGFYSADQSFIVQGGNGSNCPVGDKRINITGSIVVNAGLTSGTFTNQRDLCAGDLQCPSIYVGGRPDLIINSPQFLWNTNKVWQEVNP